MEKQKQKLNPPTGFGDWWNEGVDATIKPHLREPKREFTAQEAKEVWEHTLENGFC